MSQQVDHNTIVRIHPASLAAIIDSHERRDKKNSQANYILGTLMGTADSKLITIDQSFMVEHRQSRVEDEEQKFEYDFDHHFDMESLIRASNKDCQVVGWFSTAKEEKSSFFSDVDKMVSDLYFKPESYQKNDHKRESYGLYTKSSRSTKPIFLRINIENLRGKTKSQTSLPIQAFLPEKFNIDNENKDDADLIWTEMACEIGCGAAERTALELIMGVTNSEKEGPALETEAVGSNLDPLNNLTFSILEKIDKVQTYIQDQLNKDDHELDANMGRMLADIFTGVPGLDKDTMDGLLNGELTDLLMVTFLSHLAKVQITLNDKLKQQYGMKTVQKKAYQNRSQR